MPIPIIPVIHDLSVSFLHISPIPPFKTHLRMMSNGENEEWHRMNDQNWLLSLNIHLVWMLFKLTRQNWVLGLIILIICAKTFRTRKNFPGSNATLLPGFLGLCPQEDTTTTRQLQKSKLQGQVYQTTTWNGTPRTSQCEVFLWSPACQRQGGIRVGYVTNNKRVETDCDGRLCFDSVIRVRNFLSITISTSLFLLISVQLSHWSNVSKVSSLKSHSLHCNALHALQWVSQWQGRL